MRFPSPWRLAPLLAPLVLAPASQAHFGWLVLEPAKEGATMRTLRLTFGEDPTPGDGEMLSYVEEARVRRLGADGVPRVLALESRGDRLEAVEPSSIAEGSLYVLDHDLGVMERGGSPFLLRYYAKAGPAVSSGAWTAVHCTELIALDVVPRLTSEGIEVEVLWRGGPVPGAQVVAAGPGLAGIEVETDARGRAVIPTRAPGLYPVRARHIEAKAGKLGGKAYETIRHYTTLALQVEEKQAQDAAYSDMVRYGEIPELVTSFGAAILDGRVYIYGGHTGDAHSYSAKEQGNTLWSLDLARGGSWQSLGTGPNLQGLALVAAGGKLYRIGGFEAKNAKGQEHDLWSQSAVGVYDPSTQSWRAGISLPEPRSSFDAAVLEDRIYVVGGWKLEGKGKTTWLETAYVLDTREPAPTWRALPQPPFKRRALSVAAFDEKIYVIGGMQEKGGPTTRVDVFDPKTNEWFQGPSLEGEGMEGFGSSAFATGGALYVSTYEGRLQRLRSGAEKWEIARRLDEARFFHRMLPLAQHHLMFLGGADMSIGKFENVAVIDVSRAERSL